MKNFARKIVEIIFQPGKLGRPELFRDKGENVT